MIEEISKDNWTLEAKDILLNATLQKYKWLDCKFQYMNGTLVIKHDGVLTTVKHFKKRYPSLW